MIRTTTSTTPVEATISLRVGQLTFFISIRNSLKNCLICSNIFDPFLFAQTLRLCVVGFRFPLREDEAFLSVLAGQEGFEPPSPGFGVRCSTVRATGLHDLSFRFLVKRMGPTETAILLHGKLVGCLLLVPRGGVISPFAFPTSEGDDVCRHCLYPSSPLFGSLPESARPPRLKVKGER